MFSYDTQKTRQFQQQNRDLDLYTDDGVFIRIFENEHDWLVIMVEVGENVSNPTTALRNAAALVKEWKERLLKFQGAAFWGDKNNKNGALEGLLRMHENGKSYNEITKMVNRRIETALQEYLKYRIEIDERYPGYNNDFDEYFYNSPLQFYELNLNNNAIDMWRSRHTLLSLGLDDTEIEQDFRAGLDNLKNKKKPFAPDKPLSRRKLIETLRAWRESKQHKGIIQAENAKKTKKNSKV